MGFVKPAPNCKNAMLLEGRVLFATEEFFLFGERLFAVAQGDIFEMTSALTIHPC